MKKLLIPLAIILACIFVIMGCAKPAPTAPATTPAKPATTASPTAKPTPQYGGNLKIITPTSIGTLGTPAEGAGDYSRVAGPAFDIVFWRDKNFKHYPLLVQSWDIAPDGKTITLHLQKGVKFHDGTDCNAEALKYNLENASVSFKTNLVRISSYDVLDDTTLRLNLTMFDANIFLALSAGAGGWVASPTAMKIKSTNETMAKDHMVGTGPFKFVSWQRDINVKYTKFENYWQKGKPYLDTVEYVRIQEPTTAMMAFKAGDAQLLFQITPGDALDLQKAGYEIVLSDFHASYYMMPDGANADSPFANKSVREALEYAIDRKAIADSIGKGYYEALTQFPSTQSPMYVPGLKARSFDPARAKQLLASGGYPNGFNTTLITSSGFNRDALVIIQTYLKDIGINATLDIADSTRMTSISQNGWKNGIYLMYPPMNIDLSGLLRRFKTGADTPASWTARSMLRPAGWQDKLDTAVTQVDDNKRLTQLQDIIKLMYDEVMAIPLWSTPDISAQIKGLHDLNWERGQPYNFTFQDAWLSK